MKMTNEREVRTDNKNMLVCTVDINSLGEPELIVRLGKKEDRITVVSLLSKIYGRPVVVLIN